MLVPTNQISLSKTPTNYYVYLLINNTTMIPFYIGKGKGSRMFIHSKLAHKNKLSNKHLQSNLLRCDVIYKWMDNLTEEEAFDYEIAWIKQAKNMGIKLCNQTNGGDGTSGRIVSNDTKMKLSAWQKGKSKAPNTEEQKLTISKKLIGIKRSEETKKKMSASKIGNIPWNKGKHGVQKSNVPWNKGLTYKLKGNL